MSVDREALNKTAQRLQTHVRQTGQQMTHEQAKKIVAKHLNRSDNKKNRG